MSPTSSPILLIATLLVVNALLIECMSGGSSQELPADDKVRQMVKTFEPTIKGMYPRELVSIEPLSYKTQTVAGTNYLVKAKVIDKSGQESVVHLRLWETLFNGVKFGAMRTRVDEQTPLTSFMRSDI